MSQQPTSETSPRLGAQNDHEGDAPDGSPALPNAEHFPNTTSLMRKRREESVRTPEPSPERTPERRTADADEPDDGEDDDMDDEVSPNKDRDPAVDRSRQLAVERAQRRLEEAKRRREAMLEERNQQLRVIEQQRQRKVAVQREMRREAIDRFTRESPELFATMEESGLLATVEPVEGAANLIQHALVSDPRTCAQCPPDVAQRERVCPLTGKPHRRRLIVLAERLLKLVGETHVNLVPRRDAVGDSALAVSNQKARRGIAINPQIFVLAYYNAALPPNDPDSDPIVHASASQLVQVVEQLKSAVKSGLSGNDLKPTLLAFARAWRQYAKVAQEEVSAEDRVTAANELIESTIAAAEVTRQQQIVLQSRMDVSDDEKRSVLAELHRYEEMLRSRVQALGGTEALRRLESRLEDAQRRPPETTPAVNPGDASDVPATEPVPASSLSRPAPTVRRGEPPLAPTGYTSYTSGSETDVGRHQQSRQPAGPQLPPRWTVDENGNARAPSQDEEQREQLRLLEQRTRTAHDVRLPLFKKFASTGLFVDEAAELQKQLQTAIDESLWESLRTELNGQPPVVTKVPTFLSMLCDRLLEALPERLRGRLARELRDVLDWDMLKYKIGDPKHLKDLLQYFVSKLIMFGAPAREDALKAKTLALGSRLLDGAEPFGDVVTDVFRFLFGGVKDLREDLAQYQLTMMSAEIAAKAPEYQRLFAAKALPPPANWTRTLDWLRWSNSLEPEATPVAAQGSASSDLFHLQRLVTNGLLALLASANTTPETRWKRFPEEALYFDKKHIFVAANLTQLFTLRLMIANTVMLLMNPRRLGTINDFLCDLDKAVVAWLASQTTDQTSGGPMTLAQLKTRIVEEIDLFLASKREDEVAAGRPAPPGTGVVTESERKAVDVIVEKMVDTTSLEYRTFEKRVINAFKATVEAAMAPSAPAPQPAAAATTAAAPPTDPLRVFASVESLRNEVQIASTDILTLVRYHWETYRPFYEQLWPLVASNPAPANPA